MPVLLPMTFSSRVVTMKSAGMKIWRVCTVGGHASSAPHNGWIRAGEAAVSPVPISELIMDSWSKFERLLTEIELAYRIAAKLLILQAQSSWGILLLSHSGTVIHIDLLSIISDSYGFIYALTTPFLLLCAGKCDFLRRGEQNDYSGALVKLIYGTFGKWVRAWICNAKVHLQQNANYQCIHTQ